MYKFKKIASATASAVMMFSTVALAAAANYPAPFVSGGSADVAVIYGSAPTASVDLLAVLDVQQSLNDYVVSGGGSEGGGENIEGEAYPLFTSSTRIYLNDTLNKARTSVSSNDMPIALKDGSFQGDVTATYTQKVDLGTTSGVNNRFAFGQHPTSDDDPVYAFDLGSTGGQAIYNLSVSFNKVVNFSHSDSEGETITLFGQDWNVGAETDGKTNLILFKSADKVDLNSVDNPSAEVIVAGETYTVTIVSASDSAATIAVTDSTGKKETKEVTEDTSKTINGVEVGVTNADETTNKLSATVTVGADKVKLADNTAVKLGSDETSVEGTNVRFENGGVLGAEPQNITKLIFQMAAEDTDVDALIEGGEFVDPIFGSLKLVFSGLSIPMDSTDREEILISTSGSDKMTASFKSWDATESKPVDWYYNNTDSVRADGATTSGIVSLADSGGKAINTFERAQVNKTEYVVVGNEDTGGLWRFSSLTNDTASATASTVEFKNEITGAIASAKSSNWGTGTIDLGTKSYTFDFQDNKNVEGDENIRLRYQDGSKTTVNNAVIFPTIETSKGAKVFFYEPVAINLANWDGVGQDVNNLSVLKFPDGDGYTSLTITQLNTSSNNGIGNNNTWLINSHVMNLTDHALGDDTLASKSVYVDIGQLTYNISAMSATKGITAAGNATNNTIVVQLMNVANATMTSPALVIFEEKDDSTGQLYEALIVNIEGAGTTSASSGVSDVETTWGDDAQFDEIQVKSSNSVYKSADFWGTVITTDQTDTDSYSATISYPDEQVFAQIYMAEESASIGGGGSGPGSPSNIVSVSDTEASSVESRNWVVVGGSCVNSVAADLLGSAEPLCGSDWETRTNVGSGQFMIETFPKSESKVATLVAGYNAADTVNAAKYLTTQTVSTMPGDKYIGTSSTSAELVTGGEEEA